MSKEIEFKLVSHSDKTKFNEIVSAWLRSGWRITNTYSVVTPKSVVHYAALITGDGAAGHG